MSDLVRHLGSFDTSQLDALGASRSRVSATATPASTRGGPIIRLNGIEVTARPTHCRKPVCNIGGLKEVRAAVEQAGTNLIVARTSKGCSRLWQ